MDKINLPTRALDENFSLSKALDKRISCRNFERKSITLKELANILWAADGLNDKRYNMRRTAPSAGALYPLELYVAVRKDGVYELDEGIHHYDPIEHLLEKFSDKEIIEELAEATYNQGFIKKASVNLLIAGKNERTTRFYGERGDRYVLMEAGAVSQNIHLEAVEKELGTVIIGAFDDEKIQSLFNIDELKPLCIMPIGKPENKNIYK